MTLVRLIVTGKAEFQGLCAFLGKVFPGVKFEPEQVGSFTSCRVHSRPAIATAELLVDKFVDHLIAAVDPGRKKPAGGTPDFVVATDDLELFNLDQPNMVVNAVREAVRHRVPVTWPSSLERQRRCYELLKERASFHLLSPMLEAYFFTCAPALQAAGLRLPVDLVPDQDVEDFETRDASYLSQYESLPSSGQDGVLHPQTSTWFAKHPKEYLKFLVDLNSPGSLYRETKQGTAALQALSPASALMIESHRRFLRSLIHDLADALNLEPSVQSRGECHPETSGHSNENRLLRNI